jgi:hypothetical protein
MTTNHKHTPGPWSYDETSRNVVSLTAITVGNRAICHPLYSWDEEANTRLIAAAPDLLTALEDAEFLLRKLAAHPGDILAMRDSLIRSAQDARTAIAKAKGE